MSRWIKTGASSIQPRLYQQRGTTPDQNHIMATLSVPSPEPLSVAGPPGRPDMHRPLSTHGMPKPPQAMSPQQPHRFSALSFPPPKLPKSPHISGPMSPPMSARSFGTFIDSEPSTPAYSPRMDQAWDSSTVVLMRPMSSSSEPSTPTEPAWDMLAPAKAQHYPTMISRAKVPTILHKEMPTTASLQFQPPRQPRAIKRPRDIHVVNLNQREDDAPKIADIEHDPLPESKEVGSLSPSIAPFGKLASKMRLMLRRKNTNEKKKEKKKKREWEDVDRLEDVHWTEM
ncbi:hypothetical protein T440DRAFT_496915 [Plenodomus tracheiphilus IPT5]|uniref:Uncharacterized protein n=1 Tax=Plenodomus tracheiphilus IPT5 TaxID=1408161 RepID=A0A6A7BH83_9PLEO|nr:hypothetical protein T440DRAFT_496915 [Plenodomus tracheiphilus IPT5]